MFPQVAIDYGDDLSTCCFIFVVVIMWQVIWNMRGRAQPCDQNTGQTRGKLLYWVPNRAWAFRVALVIKNLSATAGDARVAGSTPGSERSPGVGKRQPTPVFLARKFHGREPGGLHSMELQRVRHDWAPEHMSNMHMWSQFILTIAG